MLSFFTEPYPDELIYSAIARYHFYSGNIDCKDTLEEVFQSRNVIPSVEIGSHFSSLAKQIGSNYSVESLLAKHTIYPFYAPFLLKERQQQIMLDVQGDGRGLYARLGNVAGGICKKDGLYYCPYCAQVDIGKFGEPYIHREHQLQGIDFCAHHELSLKKYPFDPLMKSRIEYIRFDAKNLNLNLSVPNEVESKDYLEVQIKLANMAYQLSQVDVTVFSRDVINQKYRNRLRDLNLVTVKNRVRQVELFQAFSLKFPKGFLEKYESEIDVENEYNWLKVITRNLKRHVHPFRHLLLIYFLDHDVESFLQVNVDTGPFGSGPWPCLNKAAKHYNQNVISKVKVTRDFKSNKPIGNFECSCGFIYARKGPDSSPNDLYRIGRTKSFGDVWQTKLHELGSEGHYSQREIARMLGVDSRTIKKYLALETNIQPLLSGNDFSRMEAYREQVLIGIQQYPNYSRTEIRQCYPKQYIYLYRYDKRWLFEQLPVKQVKLLSTKIIDWEERDRAYLSKVKILYKELNILDKPIRLTITLVGKRLGILANLEKNLDKLPQTENYLNKIKESTQQFQFRRCCKIIDRMLLENETVILWKIQRSCAVRTSHFHAIKPQLEGYLQMKREVRVLE